MVGGREGGGNRGERDVGQAEGMGKVFYSSHMQTFGLQFNLRADVRDMRFAHVRHPRTTFFF